MTLTDVDVVCEALQQLQDTGVLGRRDGPTVARLREFLRARGKAKVLLTELAAHLYPNLEIRKALGLYRGFKMRVNKRLESRKVNLRLVSASDNRSIHDKAF